MKKFTLLLAISTIAFFSVPANTAEFDWAGVDSTTCGLNNTFSQFCLSVTIGGKIEKGDRERLTIVIDQIESQFKKAGLSARVFRVEFNSPGGDLDEGMKIGRTIRERSIGTRVDENHSCNSSCVLAFVGGVVRMPLGTIGIHSFYAEEFFGSPDYAGASRQYNEVALTVENYLREMRIPISLLDGMKKVPHNSIRLLSLDELKAYALLGMDPVYMQIIEGN